MCIRSEAIKINYLKRIESMPERIDTVIIVEKDSVTIY